MDSFNSNSGIDRTPSEKNNSQKKIYLIGGSILLSLSIALWVGYFFFRSSNTSDTRTESTQSKTASVSEDKTNSDTPIQESPSVDVALPKDEEAHHLDTPIALIESIKISTSDTPTGVYQFGKDRVYMTQNPKTLKRVYYDAKWKKISDDAYDTHLYGISQGKKTYATYDSSKNGKLYIDDKFVATSDTNGVGVSPFKYRKFNGIDIYMYYDASKRRYFASIGGKKVNDWFTSAPEFFYIDNSIYVIGTVSEKNELWKMGISYCLYNSFQKIATSDERNFALQKIGNKIAYQIDHNGQFELYFGGEKIAEQSVKSIQFKEVEGKIMYNIDKIDLNQTWIYHGDAVIRKLDIKSEPRFGEVEGSLFYSYFLISQTWAYENKGMMTYFQEKMYKNISEFLPIWDQIAYKLYNKESDTNELYIDNKLIATGIVSLGKMQWKLFYTVYDKSSALFQLFYDDKPINSNNQAYFIKSSEIGDFYSTYDWSSKTYNAYFADTLIKEGLWKFPSSLFLYGYKYKNLNELKFYYQDKDTDSYILHEWLKNETVLWKEAPKMIRSYNDEIVRWFFVFEKSQINPIEVTIKVYQ